MSAHNKIIHHLSVHLVCSALEIASLGRDSDGPGICIMRAGWKILKDGDEEEETDSDEENW